MTDGAIGDGGESGAKTTGLDDFVRPPAPPLKMKRSRRAFITGSFAYGTPTKESDLDLVVLVDIQTMANPQRLGGLLETERDDENHLQIRIAANGSTDR